MKSLKLVLSSIALFVSVAAFSQTDTTKSKKDTTAKKDTATIAIQDAATNASAQEAQSTNAQQAQQSTSAQQATSATQQANASQSTTATTPATTTTTEPVAANSTSSNSTTPKPNFGRYYIPVLGSYQSSQSTGDNKSVTITGDESNPGKVWVEGLTATKFYALLKAVPGTYKIPAQKQDDNSIQEGTVVYDESSKQINICLGCGYEEKNPSAVTATEETTTEPAGKNATAKNKVKAKTTVVSFSGTKSEQGTASISK